MEDALAAGETEAVVSADEVAKYDPMAATDAEGIVKKLPCGLVKDGVLHQYAEFVPMRGRVRRAISKKDVRNDFAKVSDAVLRMCVKRVGAIPTTSPKTMAELPMGDRDFLLMEVRRASMSDKLDALVKCASCRKDIRVSFQLDEIEVVFLKDGNYEIHDDQLCFRIQSDKPRIDALCRFPIGSDQKDMLPAIDANPTDAQYRLFAACLIEWNGEKKEVRSEFFDDLLVDVIDEFTQQFVSKKPGPVFEQKVSCPNVVCGSDISFTFEGSDFFFPLPERGTT